MNIFRNKNFQYVISFLISAISLILVAHLVSWGEVLKSLNQANYFVLSVALILYILIYLIRSVRFNVLLNNKISISDLFVVNCLHNFYNLALPGRLGELTFPYFVKKISNISGVESFTQLVVARLMDLSGVALIFSFSLALYLHNFLISALFFALAALLALAILFALALPRVLLKRLKYFEDSKYVFVKKILVSLNDIQDFDSRQRVAIVSLSIVLNFLMFLFGFVVIRGLGYHISMLNSFVGGALALLTTLLPINTFFNIGTMELGWTWAFTAVGLSSVDAIASGAIYHLLNIIFTTLLFVIGYLPYLKRIIGDTTK